jgi:glycine hydroxymethyltransferase
MKEDEMRKIGELIAAIVKDPESEPLKEKVRRDVSEITAGFPMYPNRLKRPESESSAAN